MQVHIWTNSNSYICPESCILVQLMRKLEKGFLKTQHDCPYVPATSAMVIPFILSKSIQVNIHKVNCSSLLIATLFTIDKL